MSFGGAVHHAVVHRRTVAGSDAQAVAGGQDGAKGARRRRVLQHTSALAGAAVGPAVTEHLGQPAGLHQPVQHVLFQLGDRRRRRPQHALHAKSGRYQLGQHRRRGGVGREVAEEAGCLPVGERRHDHPVEVGQCSGQVAPKLGRVGIELVTHPPRLDRRPHWEVVGALPVIRHPLDHLMALGSKARLGDAQSFPANVPVGADTQRRRRLHRGANRGHPVLAPWQRHDDRLVDPGLVVGLDRIGNGGRIPADVDGIDHCVAHGGDRGVAVADVHCGGERSDLLTEPSSGKGSCVGGHHRVPKQVASAFRTGDFGITHADVNVGGDPH